MLAGDVIELMEREAALFRRLDVSEPETVCFLLIITDGGHGPRETANQFVLGLIWHHFDMGAAPQAGCTGRLGQGGWAGRTLRRHRRKQVN